MNTAEEGRIAEIPKGYAWCHNCSALTPHEKHGMLASSKVCIICGNSNHGPEHSCPNCGWELPEDISDHHKVTIHNDGCHCDNASEDDSEFFGSYAAHIAKSFKEDFFKPFPYKASWSLPEDKVWYRGHSRLQKIWDEMMATKCGCPVYTIYTNLNIFNYRTSSVFSMDCMNAMEWSFDVRCPICGAIFHVEDSNC